VKLNNPNADEMERNGYFDQNGDYFAFPNSYTNFIPAKANEVSRKTFKIGKKYFD